MTTNEVELYVIRIGIKRKGKKKIFARSIFSVLVCAKCTYSAFLSSGPVS